MALHDDASMMTGTSHHDDTQFDGSVQARNTHGAGTSHGVKSQVAQLPCRPCHATKTKGVTEPA